MKLNKQNLIKSILVSMAIFFDFSLFKSFNGINYSVFYSVKTFEMSIVCILVYKMFQSKINNNSKLKKLTSIILSIFMLIGSIYISKLSFETVLISPKYLLVSVIKLFGYYFLISHLIGYLDDIFGHKFTDIKTNNKFLKYIINNLKTKPFLTSFIMIMIVFSLYLLFYYPTVISQDASYQILQYFNIPTKYVEYGVQINPQVFMTNHHPVIQTFMLGGAIEIGRALGSDNFGLFIYTLVQTLCFASVLSYSIKVLVDNKVPMKVVSLVLLGYLIIPMYGFYTVSTVKDTYYTFLMMLLVLFIFDYIKNYKEKKLEISKCVYLLLILLFLCLFRNNGIYVILITIPLLMAFNNKNVLRYLLVFLIFYSSYTGFNKLFLTSMGISPGSIREALSVPFQQTARYVKYHEKDLTKKDKEKINNILQYKELTKYNPELSDPVKNTFNPNYTSEDLKQYFKVWLKGLSTHPLCYVDATLNNTYGYIYPSSHNWYLYSIPNKRVKKRGVVDYSLNGLKLGRDILNVYGNVFVYIPILSLFTSIGFNTWVIILEIVYLIEKKKKKYIICLVPLIASVLICFMSPANTYFRYAMPYIFALPSLLALINTSKEEKK